MASESDIRRVGERLASIARRADDLEARYAEDLARVHPEFRDSARNLLHYLALRQSDVSELQPSLAALGLSSLGRAERNVIGSIAAVCKALQSLSVDPRQIAVRLEGCRENCRGSSAPP